MAQRKSGPTQASSGKPGGASRRPGGASGSGGSSARRTSATGSATRTPSRSTSTAATSSAAKSTGKPPLKKPPARKPGKSIVNQKQTPWGLIAATVAVVLFAATIVVVVIATSKSDSSKSTTSTKGGQTVDTKDAYRQPELAAAKSITGVTYRVEGQHFHVDGHIKYDSSPPVGGNHSQYWADCTGTVYAQPIANENAVHMLEHGAVWVTYNAKTLSASGVAKLKTYVSGQDRMAMSPYPNLKTPISLQAWGYQLFVNSPADPRIAQFIATLRYNPKTTPESSATCSQPTFKTHPSTFGKPLWEPADGATGNTSGA